MTGRAGAERDRAYQRVWRLTHGAVAVLVVTSLVALLIAGWGRYEASEALASFESRKGQACEGGWGDPSDVPVQWDRKSAAELARMVLDGPRSLSPRPTAACAIWREAYLRLRWRTRESETTAWFVTGITLAFSATLYAVLGMVTKYVPAIRKADREAKR